MTDPTEIHVLLVEDDEDDVTLTRDLLTDIPGASFRLHWARSYAEGLSALRAGAYDVVLLDYRLGEGTGLDFLGRLPLEDGTPPVILLTGQGDRETDLMAMQAGAADYLAKSGLTATMLERSIRYAVERHRARVAKHEAEQRYQLLLQSVGAIVWQGDPETLFFTFVSREAEHLLGYPAERWTEERGFWPDHIHPEDRSWALAYCEEASRRGISHSFEYRMIASDGRVVWLRDIVRVVEIGGRRTLAGVMVDITAAKAAEETIRLRDRAVEAISEGIVMTDARQPDHSIVYVNPAFQELTGYPTAEILGRNCRFLQGPDTDPAAVAELRDAIRDERAATVELLNYRKDGSPFWNRLSLSPVRDARGTLTHFVGVQLDVTERRRAVAELAGAEAHYRRLVTAAPLAVYALDAAGRFIELNPAGERLLARTAGELLGQPFSLIIAPRDLPAAQGLFERTTAGAAPEVGEELWIVRPSGEERLLSVTIAPMWEGGAIRGVHGIARDITDERERERHVRRVERLAGVGTLIAGVAHELNNPLSAVLGFTRLLLMDPRPDSEREDLETIARETERMAKIVSDLRLIARDTQEDTGRRQRVDLNDVVRHVLRTRDYSLRTRNIEVGEELADGLPPLLADRGQLEQVLLNLVVNAEQAMDGAPGERTLVVRTRPTAGGASVQVVDSGRGISKAHLERIFDPFFTTKAPGEGTGLGLSLVHSIVREHKGDIRVDSEPGQGTAIRIDLPEAPPENEMETEAAPLARAARPLRVLVVDDEDGVRRVVVRTLQRRGHHVDEAAEGTRALQMLDAAAYDVIVSDLRMPGMSGDELLSRLRERSGGIEQRLIFLTGDTASPEAVRILAGADVPILPKPAAIAEVVRWVEQVGAR
jgi:PAS domain S-box-containing protein